MPLTAEQVQPAGVDLRVAEVEVFDEAGFISIEGKRIPAGRSLPILGGFWDLPPGAYRIRFLETVEIPPDRVGFCYPRSSLLRMGASLHCAVWDPGYKGRGQALLVVYNPHGLSVERGARIAQLVLAALAGEPSGLYRGDYYGEGLKDEVD